MPDQAAPPVTLIAAVLPGDGVADPEELRRYDTIVNEHGEQAPAPHGRPLTLSGPLSANCWVSIARGTPQWEQHRIARCTGAGPYLVELGTIDRPSRLLFAHPAGTVVEVCDG